MSCDNTLKWVLPTMLWTTCELLYNTLVWLFDDPTTGGIYCVAFAGVATRPVNNLASKEVGMQAFLAIVSLCLTAKASTPLY
jgi:hypothetical protein